MHFLKIGTAKKVYNNKGAKNHPFYFISFLLLFDQSTINKKHLVTLTLKETI